MVDHLKRSGSLWSLILSYWEQDLYPSQRLRPTRAQKRLVLLHLRVRATAILGKCPDFFRWRDVVRTWHRLLRFWYHFLGNGGWSIQIITPAVWPFRKSHTLRYRYASATPFGGNPWVVQHFDTTYVSFSDVLTTFVANWVLLWPRQFPSPKSRAKMSWCNTSPEHNCE